MEEQEEIMYTILQHPDIATASKKVCIDGTPYVGRKDQISEWASAMALSKYPIGTKVSEKEFQANLFGCIIDQTLLELSEKGMLEMSLNENGEVLFRLSEIGRKAAEDLDNDFQIG